LWYLPRLEILTSLKVLLECQSFPCSQDPQSIQVLQIQFSCIPLQWKASREELKVINSLCLLMSRIQGHYDPWFLLHEEQKRDFLNKQLQTQTKFECEVSDRSAFYQMLVIFHSNLMQVQLFVTLLQLSYKHYAVMWYWA